ncbi:YqaE/Pmp3 family membrane protein [Phytohalomonas tamaricis]|uniref:YqaE/Pmp3 family membrane protein n=1 Tax=Phytohalomonas tamaricis TaxID=2081032 RepID=UPI000D0AD40F|nr:YqaE/Pmp3 family membrane protein [Phytohalomonas tamaricis]
MDHYVLLVIAVIAPPAAVYAVLGVGVQFWTNVALTFLGYIPGIIHALYIVNG